MSEQEQNVQDSRRQEIEKADLAAVNDLRKATYDFEFKSLYILQSTNAAAAILVINSIKIESFTFCLKLLCFVSVIFYLIGFGSSLYLLYKYPNYLEVRYRKNEATNLFKQYKKLDNCKRACIVLSACSFIAGTIFALLTILLK